MFRRHVLGSRHYHVETLLSRSLTRLREATQRWVHRYVPIISYMDTLSGVTPRNTHL